eukprot:s1993_g17.t1
MPKCFLILLAVVLLLLSWSDGDVAVLRRMRPLAVQCSRLATLAGRNPYEKSSMGWRFIIKANFRPVYNKLVERDAGLRTKEDATAFEKKKLSPNQRDLLRKLQSAAVAAPKAVRVDAKRHGLNVSAQVAQQLEGTSVELLEAFRKQDPATADLLLKSDLIAARDVVPRREDAKTIAKAMKDQSKKLRKAAAKTAAPFQAGNTKLYSAEVAPGLLLRGKIDAHRQMSDEGCHSIDIFEHKARQRALALPGLRLAAGRTAPDTAEWDLLSKLRQAATWSANRKGRCRSPANAQCMECHVTGCKEKIQCLGYIDLVKRDSGDSGVRCFLVETFQGTSWQCEVKQEPELWKERVLGVVSKRADELQDLMRPDIATETVREWLDSL